MPDTSNAPRVWFGGPRHGQPVEKKTMTVPMGTVLKLDREEMESELAARQLANLGDEAALEKLAAFQTLLATDAQTRLALARAIKTDPWMAARHMPQPKRWPWVVALSALLVLVGVLTGLLLFRSPTLPSLEEEDSSGGVPRRSGAVPEQQSRVVVAVPTPLRTTPRSR